MAGVQPIYIGTFIAILNLGYCICLAEFEMFPGFDTIVQKYNKTTPPDNMTMTHVDPSEAPNVTNNIKEETNTTAHQTTLNPILENTTAKLPLLNLTGEPFVCLEEERPSNIGFYEVPTQRDLVKHMKTKLLKMFNNYHAKALYFLKDIKEATRATSEIAHKCPISNRETYKKCVRHVSNQCQVITKSLVTSLESQRHDVAAVTEDFICNLAAMKADPVQLIKVVAMEEASLEFALPGFLRLLSACSFYCNTNITATTNLPKPTRHMTDQDLVIRHFLTRKNYIQLIKETQ